MGPYMGWLYSGIPFTAWLAVLLWRLLFYSARRRVDPWLSLLLGAGFFIAYALESGYSPVLLAIGLAFPVTSLLALLVVASRRTSSGDGSNAMRLLLILPLAAILAIGCSHQDTSGQKGTPPGKNAQGGTQPDQKGLQGTWKFVSMTTSSGKIRPPEQIADMKITISGQQYTLTKGGKALERATLTDDPSKQPKALDLTFTHGDAKGHTLTCIYEVTGDTLRIAWSELGKPRPTEFANREGLRQDLWELRREQPQPS
jgi:uncharacterized protein (TIGR03067 family)